MESILTTFSPYTLCYVGRVELPMSSGGSNSPARVHRKCMVGFLIGGMGFTVCEVFLLK